MPCTTHAKYKSSITESLPRKLAGFHYCCLKLTMTQLYDASKLSKATLTCRFLDHVGQVPQPLAVVFHRRWLDKRLLRRRRVGTGKNELKSFIWWCLTKPRFYQPSKKNELRRLVNMSFCDCNAKPGYDPFKGRERSP